MRGHGKALAWDPRFEPYFRRAGLLAFALQFKRAAPNYNHAALSALVDRWRPETHSFHLTCGEMTVTLQDIAMIGGLPINGRPLIGRTEKRNWRNRVIGLIGDCPPLLKGRTTGHPVSHSTGFLTTCREFPMVPRSRRWSVMRGLICGICYVRWFFLTAQVTIAHGCMLTS